MFTAAPLLADTRVRAVQMAGSPELAPWHSAGTHDQDMAVMNSNAIAGGTGRGCGAAGITGLRPGTHAPGPAGSQRCARDMLQVMSPPELAARSSSRDTGRYEE